MKVKIQMSYLDGFRRFTLRSTSPTASKEYLLDYMSWTSINRSLSIARLGGGLLRRVGTSCSSTKSRKIPTCKLTFSPVSGSLVNMVRGRPLVDPAVDSDT